MKFKPTSKSGGVVVELGPQENQLPALSAAPAPFKLKNILVPVDFSECSQKALQYAISCAKQFGAELALLHVVQPYPAVPEMAPVDIESIAEAKKKLAEAKGVIDKGVSAKTLVRVGNPPVEIVDAARACGSDLIIISTHGHTGLARVFLGSTTEKVVRQAPCPVLVVRQCEREFLSEAGACERREQI